MGSRLELLWVSQASNRCNMNKRRNCMLNHRCWWFVICTAVSIVFFKQRIVENCEAASLARWKPSSKAAWRYMIYSCLLIYARIWFLLISINVYIYTAQQGGSLHDNHGTFCVDPLGLPPRTHIYLGPAALMLSLHHQFQGEAASFGLFSPPFWDM